MLLYLTQVQFVFERLNLGLLNMVNLCKCYTTFLSISDAAAKS